MANVSMKDVAALAGVSVGTVSNTLNSPDRVSDGTRTRVQAAIDKLGWVRNESARQLRAGASHLIGMVVLDISNPFFTDVVSGAEDAMAETGYSVHVANSGQWPDREATHLERFEQARVAGVLFAPVGELLDRVLRLRSLGIPVVLVDRAADAREACSVAVDDIAGGRLAAQHLLEMGHRRIAFVGGPRELSQVESRHRGAEFAASQYAQARLPSISAQARPPPERLSRWSRQSVPLRCSPPMTCLRSACSRDWYSKA